MAYGRIDSLITCFPDRSTPCSLWFPGFHWLDTVPSIQANPSKFSPFFRSLFPRTPLPTKENTAYFRSTNRSTNRVKSPASPRLSLAFVQELCYTPRQGNPIKPVLFCAIGSRTISSAGMSIRLTCGRSQVQVLYRPPKSSLTIRELF